MSKRERSSLSRVIDLTINVFGEFTKWSKLYLHLRAYLLCKGVSNVFKLGGRYFRMLRQQGSLGTLEGVNHTVRGI